MEIYNKLFHGINLGNYKEYIGSVESTDVLEQILESGYIYTQEELYLKRKEIYHLLNSFHDQKNNEVCLALHPNNTNYNKDLLFEASKYGNQSAFNGFVRNNISLILDEELLKKRLHKLSGMYGEIRVEDSISLIDNLVAIGYYDEIDNVINTLEQILINEDEIWYKKVRFMPDIHEFIYTKNLDEHIKLKKEKYFIIKQSLEKYKFSVPIVDTYTGKTIQENIESQTKNALETKEKIMKMMRL